MSRSSLVARTLAALLVGAILVVVCYCFVDRPVAWFVHDHRFFPARWLRWPPMVSSWLKNVAIGAIAAVVAWRLWRRGGRLQTVLLAASADLVIATALKSTLKMAFGRTWPEGWKPDIASLVDSGAYGFHPFTVGVSYESFPSGHALVTCSLMTLLGMAYPRARWGCAAVGAIMCVALVGMNYHFVGDVVAGAVLGTITGVYVARGLGVAASGSVDGNR